MMELVDDYGNTVFETIKITLVCGTLHFSYTLHTPSSKAVNRAQTSV